MAESAGQIAAGQPGAGQVAEVKMYSDFKSPYAYLSFDPAMALPQRFDVRVRWIPFQLRVEPVVRRNPQAAFYLNPNVGGLLPLARLTASYDGYGRQQR